MLAYRWDLLPVSGNGFPALDFLQKRACLIRFLLLFECSIARVSLVRIDIQHAGMTVDGSEFPIHSSGTEMPISAGMFIGRAKSPYGEFGRAKFRHKMPAAGFCQAEWSPLGARPVRQV